MGKSIIANGGSETLTQQHADAVKRGLESFHHTASERERLDALCVEQAQRISLLDAENENLHTQLTRAIAERDHYMQAYVEACTQLTSVGQFIAEAVKHMRQAPFRRVADAASALTTTQPNSAIDDGVAEIAKRFASEPYKELEK